MINYITEISLIAGAAGLLSIGVYLLLKIKRISVEGEEVEGHIKNLSQNIGIDSTISYPTVEFTPVGQNIITKKSSIGFIPGYYKIGEKIRVIYKKSNPESFIIKNRVTYLSPWFMICIGSAILLFLGFITLNKT